MRRSWALTALIVVSSACASKPPPAPAQARAQPIITPDVMPSWGRTQSQVATKPKVQVRGIEGTLHNFDVKVKIEEHNKDFAACQSSRPRKAQLLAGTMEFGIHVKHSGDVADVDLRNSDVGDRALERCFIDVIRSVHFPRPNGGDANVTYTMLLGPEGKAREAEEWGPGRVQHLVAKHGEELREGCALPNGEVFTVTAYINGSGRVISAGVAGKAMSEVERFDCIAAKLAGWEMPKPTKKRIAKVTFPLRSSGRT
ncbi:MAG TPA: AgmX/PglI C-terminal domain-containing protein [Polyangiales bacterium]